MLLQTIHIVIELTVRAAAAPSTPMAITGYIITAILKYVYMNMITIYCCKNTSDFSISKRFVILTSGSLFANTSQSFELLFVTKSIQSSLNGRITCNIYQDPTLEQVNSESNETVLKSYCAG